MINEKTYEELAKHESILANNFACNNVKDKEEFVVAIKRVGKLLYELIPEHHKLQLSKDIAKYLSFISNNRVSTDKIIDILNRYEEDQMTIAELFDREREEGVFNEKIEIAKKMLGKGSDFKFILEITNLSKEKLEELKKEIEH